MNSYHAAALVLAGWYLLTPPLIKSSESYNPKAPLRQWQVWKTFESAPACNEAVKHLNGAQLNSIDPGERYTALMEQTPGFQFQCISSDDPRLAK